MKLLIVTQKVDKHDDVLGFMHGWIAEFAKRFERVTVICLGSGVYDLPANVRVLSLGKENGRSRLKYIFNFFKYIWQERHNYDAVFVHMNPEYIVLGGFLWRIWNKTVSLWYAHGHVTSSLRVAEKFCNIIFTSTVSGCRIQSDKIRVIGQGIDVNKFKIKNEKLKNDDDNFKIVTVGRISPSKDYETLIRAVEVLRDRGFKIQVDIIGGLGLTDQGAYFRRVRKLVLDSGLEQQVNFIGPVPNEEIVPYLQHTDLFVNMGQTGSLDKAVLEAMAVGLPILTCNEAFAEVLDDYVEILMYSKRDAISLANKIKQIMEMNGVKRADIGLSLRGIIKKRHSLELFVGKIFNDLRSYNG